MSKIRSKMNWSHTSCLDLMAWCYFLLTYIQVFVWLPLLFFYFFPSIFPERCEVAQSSKPDYNQATPWTPFTLLCICFNPLMLMMVATRQSALVVIAFLTYVRLQMVNIGYNFHGNITSTFRMLWNQEELFLFSSFITHILSLLWDVDAILGACVTCGLCLVRLLYLIFVAINARFDKLL